MTAPELAARLGLRRHGREWRGACPLCAKPALTVEEKGGRALWRCFYGCDQAALTSALIGGAPAAVAAPASSSAPAQDDARAAAARLWDAALPAEGGPAAAYLAGRGLRLPAGAPLRLLPNAKHPSGGRFLCMLARLDDAAGRPVAVHRTFLAPGGAGKAAVEPVRMTLGPVRGAAVRLHQAADRLVIAEGIETALAAAALLRAPAWAAVSAGNLRDTLALPPAVREVIVAADNDKPGLEAARAAAARWRAEGRAVRIAVPDKAGADFNDVLRERTARAG